MAVYKKRGIAMKIVERIVLLKKNLYSFGALFGLVALFYGCSSIDSSTGNYDSASQYSKPIYSEVMKKAMEYEGIDRNPVIFIHGFLGSKLRDIKTGENVWGDFNAYDALAGYSDTELHELSYPMEYGKPLDKIKDNAESVCIMGKADIDVMGIQFKLNAYDKIIEVLQKTVMCWREILYLKIKTFIHYLFFITTGEKI